MFTGIVEAVGRVREASPTGGGLRLAIEADGLFDDVQPGESISVNGVCLTVAEHGPRWVRFDVVPETVSRSTLATLRPASPVNLERALQPTSRLGGHFVQGHVDGVGTVRSVVRDRAAYTLSVQAPREVTDYLVEKGSVAVDGVSLTVARLDPDGFAVALVPHTLGATTLGRLRPGDAVNLEADLIGKYVARYLGRYRGDDARLLRLLQDEGFVG